MSADDRWIVPLRQNGNELKLWQVGPFKVSEISTAVRILSELPLHQRPEAAWIFRGVPDMKKIADLVATGAAIGDAPGAETFVVFPSPDRDAS